MSQENVEIVRGYWEVVGRLLDEYWANPDVPLTESSLIDDMGAFDLVHPDAEWTPAGQLRTAHGREEWLSILAEGLDVVEYWRPAVEDVIDGGNDEVVAVVRVSIRGQGSGVAVSQQIFSVVTVREGQIARITEYTDRADALEAAGLGQ